MMYIFDIDGTLLYTIETIAFYTNKALEKFGLGQVPTKKVKEFVGNASRFLIEKSLNYVGAEGKGLEEEVLAYYLDLYRNNPSYMTKPYDGIEESLATLKSRGEIVTAFSNKPDDTLKILLNDIFKPGTFDYILGQADFYKRKPSPEGIFILKEKFGEDYSDILYFGDSEVDISCGKNANIYTIACSRGYREREILQKAQPDLIIDSPAEICSIRRA